MMLQQFIDLNFGRIQHKMMCIAFRMFKHTRQSSNTLQILYFCNKSAEKTETTTTTTKIVSTQIVTAGTKSNFRERPSSLIDEIIRVDHAGELGADRIYAGQMAVLGNGPKGEQIRHMWQQEKEHREKFEQLINEYRVRPTVMVPIWHVAGFVLGAGTALLGEKAAMACTVAVENVIVEHYNDQLRQILNTPKPDKELLDTITKFRDQEQEHHDIGIESGAEQAPFYKALTKIIETGCKIAISISKKI